MLVSSRHKIHKRTVVTDKARRISTVNWQWAYQSACQPTNVTEERFSTREHESDDAAYDDAD